jgi:hypothetical protein
MTEDGTDRTLRSLFRRQRSEEGKLVPPFESVLAAATVASARTARPTRGLPRLAVAAALAAGLVLALDLSSHRAPQPVFDVAAWSSLSQWSAPTDPLLEWSGSRVEGVTITTPSDTWFETDKEQG